MNYKIQEVHISRIKAGDIVMHEKKMKNVSPKDLKFDKFMGITLFGDCFSLGYKKVEKVIIDTPKIPLAG